MSDIFEQKRDKTRRVIDKIFDQPPVSSIDLRNRLVDVNRPLSRKLMVDRLARRGVSDREGPLILAVLDVLSVGDERRRLTAVALDAKREAKVRMWAAMALAGEDPRMMDLLITELGPEGMAHLAENALVELMTIQNPVKIGKTILRALEEWHHELSAERLLARIDICRQGLGLSCAEAYDDAMRSPKLRKLRRVILDLFVAEGSDEGISYLETLKSDAAKPADRRDLQATLLRLRSARIDPKQLDKRTSGRALVSNCDGHGGFIILGVFENPDHTKSISELYIHADGAIRDGVVHARLNDEDTERMIAHLRKNTHCYFVEVPVERGATLVGYGLERTGALADIERREMRQAIRFFRRVNLRDNSDADAKTSSKDSLNADDIRAVLARPEYEDTWLFDLSDLAGLGISLGDEGHTDDDWINACAAQIGGTELSSRVLAMAEHMSKWHTWKGEQEEAALLSAMADDIAEKSEDSLLLHVMLERFADWVHAE